MATAVLDVRPAPIPPPPRRISRVVSEPPRSQGSRHPQESHVPTPHQVEEHVVAQLGRLASQHHVSEYNQLKFGPTGSPLIYVPYSMQMPDHYKEMQAHQSRCAQHRAWWLHSKKLDAQASTTTMPFCIEQMPPQGMLAGCIAPADLREQLSAAISSSIIPRVTQDRYPELPTPQPHWQTSETHPIVISTLIPSETLQTISGHLQPNPDHYPTIFDLPPAHSLHRLIPSPSNLVTPNISLPSLANPSLAPRPLPAPSQAQSLAKSLKLTSLFWVHPTVKRALLGGDDPPQKASKKRPRPTSFVASASMPLPSVDVGPQILPKVSRNRSSPATPDSIAQDRSNRRLDARTALPVSLSASVISMSIPAVPSIPPAATKMLGNLYMSSCPGKKVRLDGPVRGRNTVCRDLRSDLTRIKGVGVTCIICCLDDTELLSLGVSWSDYAHVADDLGIDVLRIPIPEGLAPLDTATLDSHLSRVIESYTLRGSAVLVHCRGGVGRAGIIACCWMLKLGICGWLESQPSAPSCCEAVSESTLSLVERLISVVRRRRSPKAIETYEQVKFLVDYVEFLRQQQFPRPPSESTDLFADWDTSVE